MITIRISITTYDKLRAKISTVSGGCDPVDRFIQQTSELITVIITLVVLIVCIGVSRIYLCLRSDTFEISNIIIIIIIIIVVLRSYYVIAGTNERMVF